MFFSFWDFSCNDLYVLRILWLENEFFLECDFDGNGISRKIFFMVNSKDNNSTDVFAWSKNSILDVLLSRW